MKVGLVLSGGGGKGAYELGVWKALKKLNIDKYIDVFSGTSIGAFNAVLFAQDDIKAAEKLWEEVTMEQLAPLSKIMLLKKGIELTIGGRYINFAKKHMQHRFEVGVTPKDGATEIINRYLKVDIVKRRGKICYVTCAELPDLKPKYFKITDYDDELAKDMVIASASLPLIYDCSEIQGGKYIDGGLADNTPIKPVYDEGCEIIIVVLLSKVSKVNKSLYPNSKIIEIIPQNLDGNIIKGTLNLDMITKSKRIQEGYSDTISLLEPIMFLASMQKNREESEKHSKLFKMYNWAKKITDKEII